MWETVTEMLKSKKAVAALVACVTFLAGRFGWHLDQASMLEAVTPLWLYILAQAAADHGKEAAKINAQAAAGMLGSSES